MKDKPVSLIFRLTTFLLALPFASLHGANISYTGGTNAVKDTVLSNPSNWSYDTLPGPNDMATITGGSVGTTDNSGKSLSLGGSVTLGFLNLPEWSNIGATTFGDAADLAEGHTFALGGFYRAINNWGNVTVKVPARMFGNAEFDIRAQSMIFEQPVSGDGISLFGNSTLTFKNEVSLTESLTANRGTIRLEFGANMPLSNLIPPATPWYLRGGSIALKCVAGKLNSQTVDFVAAQAGHSVLSLEDSWEGGTGMLLNMTDIDRDTGATLAVKQPSNKAPSANSGFITLRANDASGILAPWLFVVPSNGSTSTPPDYATRNTSGNIVAFGAYASVDSAALPSAADANLLFNASTPANLALSATDLAVHTLKVADATPRTISVAENETLSLDGLLTLSNAGALTFDGDGILTSGSDEIVFANSSAVTVNLPVTDNAAGSVALTKTGSGALTLANKLLFTGGLYLNNGTITLSVSPATTNALSPEAAIVLNHGTLDLGGSTQFIDGDFVMRAQPGGDAATTSTTLRNGTLFKTNGNFVVEGGTIEAGLRGSAGFVKTSRGHLILKGVKSYAGATEIRDGSVVIYDAGGALSGPVIVGTPDGRTPVSLTASGTPLSSSQPWTVHQNGSLSTGGSSQATYAKLTINGGAFAGTQPYFHQGSSIDMRGGALGGTIYGNAATISVNVYSNDTPATISASLRNHSMTFNVERGGGYCDLILSGNVNDNRTVTKNGNGIMRVTAGSAYAGGTTINAGTYLADTTGGSSATGSGAVTIKAGATLGGTGFIRGASANIAIQGAPENPGTLAPGSLNYRGEHVFGTLTIGSNTQANNLSLAADTAFKVSFAADGTHDAVMVYGQVLCAAGSRTLIIDAPETLKKGTYVLMEATGGISGGFDTIVFARGQKLGGVVHTPDQLLLTVAHSTLMMLR